MELQIVLFLYGLCYSLVYCWPCPQDVTRVYARPGSRAVLAFQTTIQPESELIQYFITAYNGSNLYAASFYDGVLDSTQQYFNSIFIGNVVTGNFTVQTNNLQTTDAGVYRLQHLVSSFTTDKCFTLYILGIPTQPNIQSSNDPSVGDDATLTCESTSTTVPTNHSLSRSYNWNVDNSAVTSSGRYSLLGNTLVVSNVAKIDKHLKFTCTSTEIVTNGYTSDSSGEYSINVLYGPDVDTTTLSPPDTTYTQNEGTSLNGFTCVGDCYPACSYKWTQSGTTVSTTDVLSLGTLNRNEAAIYTCTVTNPWKSGSVTKQVTVNVRYGPDTAILTPAASSYTRNVNTVLPGITCASDCYPTCNIKWTKSGSVISNTGVLSLGTLDKNDAATYTCTVFNPGTSATVTKHVEIFVRYGPDRCDISVQSPYTAREGNSIPTITCQTVCYPACSQRWNNVSINSPVGSGGDLSLGIVSRYKAGEYSCTCSNIVQGHYDKSLHNTVHVIVQYPPDVGVILSTTDISEGNELLLTCDAKGVPLVYNYNRLSQTWGNSDIHSIHTAASGTPMYSSLRMPSLQLQDSGTYTCRVNNGITNTQGVLEDSVDTVFIKVKGQHPEEPTHFTYLFKDNAHTFSWIGGFNGGYTQTFVVQTSIIGTEEWINRTTITEIGQGVASYQASITTLPSGTYFARIFAWTIEGTSEYVRLNDTFSIIKVESGPETSTFPVSVVAGWVSTVIVFLIISTGAVIFHKRRYGQKDRNPSRSANRNIRSTTVEASSYYNVAHQGNTTTHQSAMSDFRVESGTVQEHDRHDFSTYEALDASNEASSTYSSLTPAVDKPSHNVTYEHLQLHKVSS